MQHLNDNIQDEQYIVEFDELVSSTLSRIDIDYNIALKNFDPDTLKVFNSLSSVSSNSSLSSINSYKERKCQNADISRRELSLNSNSFYTGAQYKPSAINDKENQMNKSLSSASSFSSSCPKYSKYTTSKSESMINAPAKSCFSSYVPPRNIFYKSKEYRLLDNNNSANDMISQSSVLTQTDNQSETNTDLDISVYHSSDNMCSSMIQDVDYRRRKKSTSSNSKHLIQNFNKKKKTTKNKTVVLGNRNKRLQFNLLNDLIMNLMKYMNEVNKTRVSKNKKQRPSINGTKKTDLKQKVKMVTLLSYLNRLVLEQNESKSNMWYSFLTILLRTFISHKRMTAKLSQVHQRKKKRLTTSKSNSYSSKRSSVTATLNTPILTDSTNKLVQPKSGEDSDDFDSQKNWNQTQNNNKFEIPNIEDPCQFIDTLYNQLLCNANESDSSDLYLRGLSSSNDWDESSHNSNSNISEYQANNRSLDCEIDSASKTANKENDNFNYDDLNCSIENHLSMIDYFYSKTKPADLHSSSSPSPDLKETEAGTDVNTMQIEWNFEQPEPTNSFFESDTSTAFLMGNKVDTEPGQNLQSHVTTSESNDPLDAPEFGPIEQIAPMIPSFQLKSSKRDILTVLPSLAFASPSLQTIGFSYASTYKQEFFSSGIDFQRKMLTMILPCPQHFIGDTAMTATSDSNLDSYSKALVNFQSIKETIPSSLRCVYSENQKSSLLDIFLKPKSLVNSSRSLSCYDKSVELRCYIRENFFECLKLIVLTKNSLLLPLILFLLNQRFVSSAILFLYEKFSRSKS